MNDSTRNHRSYPHQYHRRDQQDPARRIKGQSKRLSWLLRHGAGGEGLAMDSAGWVRIQDLLAKLRLSQAELEMIVRENNKSRFEVSGDLVRAAQGHSLEVMPVTQDALEASWSVYQHTHGSIWHATQQRHVDSILAQGIMRGDRTHVHLASSIDSHVGKRTNAPILVEVSVAQLRASGEEVFESPNGVVLTRYVPSSSILKVRRFTSRRR